LLQLRGSLRVAVAVVPRAAALPAAHPATTRRRDERSNGAEQEEFSHDRLARAGMPEGNEADREGAAKLVRTSHSVKSEVECRRRKGRSFVDLPLHLVNIDRVEYVRKGE